MQPFDKCPVCGGELVEKFVVLPHLSSRHLLAVMTQCRVTPQNVRHLLHATCSILLASHSSSALLCVFSVQLCDPFCGYAAYAIRNTQYATDPTTIPFITIKTPL